MQGRNSSLSFVNHIYLPGPRIGFLQYPVFLPDQVLTNNALLMALGNAQICLSAQTNVGTNTK